MSGGADALVDTLIGLAGNDTYALANGSDIVTEVNGTTGGIDTITSTISRTLATFANVENVTLLGAGNINATGNAAANIITGNSGNNILTAAWKLCLCLTG